MDFPKKQAQRLMPLYLLEYSEKLFTNHPDPSAPWGGGGGSDYTAGQGITITNNEISVDTNVIATKSDIPTNYVTLDTDQTITGYKTISNGFMVGDPTKNCVAVGNSGWGISTTTNDIVDDFGAMISTDNGAYFNYLKYSDSDPSNVTANNTYKLPHQDAVGENTYTLATTNDIPTVNNPTIRFTQGGVTKGTITLNQSNDQIIAFDDGAQPDCPFLNVSDPRSQMFFSLDGSEFSWYKYVDLSAVDHQFYVNLSALNPVFKDGLTSTYNEQTNQLEVSLNAVIPTKTSDLFNDSGYVTETWVQNQGYATSSEVPSTATSTSTSTVTPTTGTFVTGTSTNTTNVVNSVTYTPSSETLTFTYEDNTTASFTFLTSSTTVTSGTTSVVSSVTDSTSNAMTGATVSTSTTTTLS